MNIVTVRRPELTDEERARRMDQIKEAAARLIAATYSTNERRISND